MNKTLNQKRYKKVFITGIFGVGKTTFAKDYANKNNLPFIDFDKIFDYAKINKHQAKKILLKLPQRFVMDAIPISSEDLHRRWDDFIDYEKRNNCMVICLYCPDHNILYKRLYYRSIRNKIQEIIDIFGGIFFPGKDVWRNRLRVKAIKSNIVGTKNCAKELFKPIITKPIITMNVYLGVRREFWATIVPFVKNFRNVKYYDTINKEFTSPKVTQDRIRYDLLKLQYHLDNQIYDKKYQDIEVINFVGYSESYKTWRNIKNLVNWENKKVIDLGCFHGYFSFKIEEQGGKVLGLDNHSGALKTARMINQIRKGRVKFQRWEDGQTIPECDIILCLNVLHHFKNPDKALSKFKTKHAIFEINKDQQNIVEKYFKIVNVKKSHRNDRIILLTRRKRESKR